MSQTPLAFCDNPDPKRRHVLARLVSIEGRAKISLAVGDPDPTKPMLHTPRGLSMQSAAWGSVDLEEIENSDTNSDTTVFCRNCRRVYRLSFRSIIAAYRNREKPPVLTRTVIVVPGASWRAMSHRVM